MSNEQPCEPSRAHKHDMNWYGIQNYADRLVPWHDAEAPDIEAGRTTGRLRSCGYCGSMHPADVAAAIRAGATGEFADRKYGWPHKVYFNGIPNPHAGMPESRCGHSNPPQDEIDAGKWVKIPDGFDQQTGAQQFRWTEAGSPAAAKTHGKFYTVHLQDATPEDRKVIELHLGVAFTFDDVGGVSWRPAKDAYPES